eukprot:NODE_3298_length_2057_cov_4.546114.p1 GENE.NODE_3298_length_2057_cov_4.546114~~NODE_3298_length_2057_cov_4.546114.p1  ORF type:complete len:372 (-),score=78.05 NODE_3298_length_2057_cov_4.546114:844-1959(-)
MRSGCRKLRKTIIAYSDDEKTNSKVTLPQIVEDSYKEGAVEGLDNSQGSLNKRLASVAGLDGSEPTDFRFLFNRRGNCPGMCNVLADGAGAEGEVETGAGSSAAPAVIDDGEFCWLRTCISKGADLVDGRGWIDEFETRLAEEQQNAADAGAASEATDQPRVPTASSSSARQPRQPRALTARVSGGQARALRMRISGGAVGGTVGGGGAPGGATPAAGDLALRNRVLREMTRAMSPGRKVRLSNGQDVVFWFNVGAPGPPRSRVYVTEARCPHQGVCLLTGELKELEDATGASRATIRCPRHNKVFDICTGESAGNAETLHRFPCRFMHGRWYVGVRADSANPAPTAPGTPRITSPRAAAPPTQRPFFSPF